MDWVGGIFGSTEVVEAKAAPGLGSRSPEMLFPQANLNGTFDDGPDDGPDDAPPSYNSLDAPPLYQDAVARAEAKDAKAEARADDMAAKLGASDAKAEAKASSLPPTYVTVLKYTKHHK